MVQAWRFASDIDRCLFRGGGQFLLSARPRKNVPQGLIAFVAGILVQAADRHTARRLIVGERIFSFSNAGLL